MADREWVPPTLDGTEFCTNCWQDLWHCPEGDHADIGRHLFCVRRRLSRIMRPWRNLKRRLCATRRGR